jgi:ATP-dependent DNA helicase RecG
MNENSDAYRSNLSQSELQQILNGLIADWESEVVEFKSVGDSYSTSDIGKYVSALANEANLRNVGRAWLIFGINNKTRQIESSDYRRKPEHLESLKHQIYDDSNPPSSFREIHVLNSPVGRVVMFEIASAPRGFPIAWKGHFYAREGESLVALSIDKQDQIRNQPAGTDWSAAIVKDASFGDLDDRALDVARKVFAKKNPDRIQEEEVLGWSTKTFLDRVKVSRDGQITRTALLLLGKPESAHLLSPHPAQITWKLIGEETAYEHFGPPFLLTTSEVYQRIRNIQMRILPADSLLAVEVSKYDQRIILEALHNCLAHQDYRRNARILVSELVDRLILENEGEFFEGQPSDYVFGNNTPRRYRNTFLAQAMTKLNMIDTLGFGIHSMYSGQKKRYFPMPDYDLDEAEAVKLTIYGKVIDEAYSKLLILNTDIALDDVFALDRVQKRLPVADDVLRQLRKKKLIEGRKPNIHVSSNVASATGMEADYIRTRGHDDTHYKKMIVDYLAEFQPATRDKIDELLFELLGSKLTDAQKKRKISRLLTALKNDRQIENSGTRSVPLWNIASKENQG